MKKLFLSAIAFCLSVLLSTTVLAVPKVGTLEELGTGWEVTAETESVRGIVQGDITIHIGSDKQPDLVSVFCAGCGFCMQVNEDGYIEVQYEGVLSNKQTETVSPLQANEKRVERQKKP